MKTSQILIGTKKHLNHESEEIISHKLMLKSGLIDQHSSGIYYWLPTGLKVLHKIKNIIIKNMKILNANEVLLPNILSQNLLKKSKRLNSFGKELLRVKDRYNKHLYYGPTHEEPIIELMKKNLTSYKQLPIILYQIQNKFRDEIRPRFGIMRSREFIMKDAYSFHLNEESLNTTYQNMISLYSKIFKTIGIKFKIIKADSGQIGGSISHEFQALSNVGEDTICYSNKNHYAENIHYAKYKITNINNICKIKKLNIIKIEDISTINDNHFIKTIIIKDNTNIFYMCLIRKKDTINMHKIKQLLLFYNKQLEIVSNKEILEVFKISNLFIGPLNSKLKIIVDYSAKQINNFICGANIEKHVYVNVNWKTNIKNFITSDIRNITTDDFTPDGKYKFKICKGMEIAHLFKLNDIYSKPMNLTINKNNNIKNILMGCYGIGISRIVAAIIEQHHDQHGITWPETIAPYHVIILPIYMNKNINIKKKSYSLYNYLLKKNIDVLLDDRNNHPSIMFADADLIGIPHQVIVGQETINNNNYIEYKHRLNKTKEILSIKELLNKFNNNIK